MRIRAWRGWVAATAAAMALGVAVAQEPVGVRPYELDWAGRVTETPPPLVDFENLDGWRVETVGSEARFERTREQQIWGRYVGKLTYRGTGAGANEVRIVPPRPIPVRDAFDAMTLWVYGNNWGYSVDPSTPQVTVSALFRTAGGLPVSVYLYSVDWTEWNLLHRRLSDTERKTLGPGCTFVGFSVKGGRQKDDRSIYLDNLCLSTEAFAPLTFEPRPERGIAMFPGQGSGTNNGPGKLPFPTRVETILPPAADQGIRRSTARDGAGARFTFADRTGVIEYRYAPRTGLWDDLTATFTAPGGKPVAFRPCVGGGAWLRVDGQAVQPTAARLVRAGLSGGRFEAVWDLEAQGVRARVAYRLQGMGKSLVIDTEARGGAVAEVRYGRAVGAPQPRLVTHPFYPADGGRPATLVMGTPQRPLFLTGNVDWYRTNASTMWATNTVDKQGALYNGGTRYTPLTDGKVNDCFERFFLTLSPIFEETLPVVANPVSPWKKVTGTRVWRAHGAGNREGDKRYWSDVKRHGITQVIVTDHETMWRDGGESFTFRTRTAPGKGGDAGARDYSRFMQDKLGFVYGPYNNFTDFAPVNGYWSTDLIARDPANQLQHAWMRCYAPKPARAVEYCARLSPINQSKYGFSTAYCDVHTAVAPWHRVDYDARVPGAGTMAAVFYSYGEIMLHQKKAWNGPVYSEGNHHAFYCGLTDGNYGQDQAYRPAENPWLVDFDLRRLHGLGCNFGMGAPDMFYANAPQPQETQAQRDAWLDRFLTATVAFGHPGFLVMEAGWGGSMRSYYMLQQLHSRYCLAAATDIRYVDGAGRLLTSSQAVASGAFTRSQVVTRYSDGTITAANGSKSERLRAVVDGRRLDLPPNGYAGWSADGRLDVLSGDRDGRRIDTAVTPEYLYIDGRGAFTRTAKAASTGVAVCRFLPGATAEVITLGGLEAGFAIRAASATALDADGKAMGKAELRAARGLTWVMPVKGAFSYRLAGVRTGGPAVAAGCSRDLVTPGETVMIGGAGGGPFTISPQAEPGSRIWKRTGAGWVDFTTVSAADLSARLEGDELVVSVTSHLAAPTQAAVTVRGEARRAAARPGVAVEVRFTLARPVQEDAETLRVEVAMGAVRQSLEAGLSTVLGTRRIASMPARWQGGVGLRGQKELPGFGTSGAHVSPGLQSCGGVQREGIALHPAWLGGAVGYAYALYDPQSLPAGEPAAFRALVGKMDGSDPGDGILYKLVVVDRAGVETAAASQIVRTHGWFPFSADLSRWAGQTVRLKVVADPGEADNSGGDWAAVADMRLEALRPSLLRTLERGTERTGREPGPMPLAGLTLEQVRTARRAWLRYDGKGLNGGRYTSTFSLNDKECGPLTEAGGDETRGVYSERIAAPIAAEGVPTLGRRNRLAISNPNGDSFSIRRFWIELELADGRRCSSDISTATFTQPLDWPYAEGIRIPATGRIEVDVWFALR